VLGAASEQEDPCEPGGVYSRLERSTRSFFEDFVDELDTKLISRGIENASQLVIGVMESLLLVLRRRREEVGFRFFPDSGAPQFSLHVNTATAKGRTGQRNGATSIPDMVYYACRMIGGAAGWVQNCEKVLMGFSSQTEVPPKIRRALDWRYSCQC